MCKRLPQPPQALFQQPKFPGPMSSLNLRLGEIPSPHFTDGETVALGGEGTCSLGLRPGPWILGVDSRPLHPQTRLRTKCSWAESRGQREEDEGLGSGPGCWPQGLGKAQGKEPPSWVGEWVMSPRGIAQPTAQSPLPAPGRSPHPRPRPLHGSGEVQGRLGASAHEARLPREIPRAECHPPTAVTSPHTEATTAPLRVSHASPGSTEGKYVNLTSIMAF